jgi:hypothetical protein
MAKGDLDMHPIAVLFHDAKSPSAHRGGLLLSGLPAIVMALFGSGCGHADTAACKLFQVDGDTVSPAIWCDDGSTPSIKNSTDYDALGRPTTITQSATCGSDTGACGERTLVLTSFVYATNGRPKSYSFRLSCSRSGESHSGSIQITRNDIGQVDSYLLRVDGATCS